MLAKSMQYLRDELTEYVGASDEKNRKGPMMLPAQYATNSNEVLTAFFVKPATFEVTMDKLIGIPAAYAMKMNRPNKLLPVLGPKRTRMLPIKLMMLNVAAMRHLEFFNLLHRYVEPSANIPCITPVGIWSR